MKGLKLFILSMWWCTSIAYSQPHTLEVFNTGNSPLPENNIFALALSPDSTLWIGTENGLATLKNGQWNIIDTLNGYQIRDIVFDTSGHAWVGTFLNGLWIETDTGWRNHTAANSNLPDDYVRSISFCPNGDAWIGTVAGAVHISNSNWTVFRQNNTPWYTEHITSSYCNPANEVWLGGLNSGLMHQVDTGWVIYRTNVTGLPDNTILDIQPRFNGAMWLATPAAGAAIFDGKQGWLYYNTNTSFNPSNSINQITVGNDGRSYLASADKGLVVFEGGLAWFHLSTSIRPDTGGAYLPANDIFAIAQDAEGVIWASASNNGLLRIEFLDYTTSVALGDTWVTTLIYPNPTTDFIYIESPVAGLDVSIADIAGHLVFASTTVSPSTKISLRHLPKGTYFLTVSLLGDKAVRRVIVFY
ncbi:hypothetical protein BH09BAC1_BH09BAC1_00940 [soil metagenome]